MTMMEWRREMSLCFRNLGGVVHGISVPTGRALRFKPAIDAGGALYVAVYQGRSNVRWHVLALDEWAEWAAEYVRDER